MKHPQRLRFFVMLMTGLILGSVGTWPQSAEARAGRGRSVGRSFGGGSTYRRATPPPSGQNQQPSYSRPTYPQTPPQQMPPAAAPAPSRGGFFKGLAGGIAGGFLGSMLFSTLGRAVGFGHGVGGGGGGFGFFEIAMVAALAWFAYRFWKKRQETSSPAGATMGTAPSMGPSVSAWEPTSEPPIHSTMRFPGLTGEEPEAIDKDFASDAFFRIQGAWTRRDLGPVKDLLGPELQASLLDDLKELLDGGRINRLENISIRNVEVVRSWHDHGVDYSTVCFLANLLDYTVEEKTGRVLEGSDSVPVKFEEYWTFGRTDRYRPWRVMGIEQA